MPKVLLVDTNLAVLSTYESILERGHEVWVIGNKTNEPLAKVARNYIKTDYSDTSKLGDIINDIAFDFIVPGCTDLSYMSCAKVSNGRFPGLDTADVFDQINNKKRFRELATKIGISVPRVISYEEAIGEQKVIVKPVDSFSGNGISILNTPNTKELAIAFDKAKKTSQTKDAIIEKFVSGQLYSHSAFISDGHIIADFIVREDSYTNRFSVDTSCLEYDFPTSINKRLRDDSLLLFRELKLVNGLIHSQFILEGDRYWIIETTRRCPGDLYALLIEMSTGYGYGSSYAASFLGEQPFKKNDSLMQNLIIRHTTGIQNERYFLGFKFSKPLNIKAFFPLKSAHDFLNKKSFTRTGHLFLEASCVIEKDQLFTKLLNGDIYSYRVIQ